MNEIKQVEHAEVDAACAVAVEGLERKDWNRNKRDVLNKT